MIGLIDEACDAGARLSKATEMIGISCRTIQRWNQEGDVKGDARGKAAKNRTPHNKLSGQERENVLDIANSPEFANLPPSQIVPILADWDQRTIGDVVEFVDLLSVTNCSKLPHNHCSANHALSCRLIRLCLDQQRRYL